MILKKRAQNFGNPWKEHTRLIDIGVWKHKHARGGFTNCIKWITIPPWQQPTFNYNVLWKKGCKGNIMNVNYSIIPHFKINFMPKDWLMTTSCLNFLLQRKTNQGGGLGNLEGMEIKIDGHHWIKVNKHNASSFLDELRCRKHFFQRHLHCENPLYVNLDSQNEKNEKEFSNLRILCHL